MTDESSRSVNRTITETLVECPNPRCWSDRRGGTTFHRQRGPDCMYAVCDSCKVGWDIGWGPNPRYFPNEGKTP